MIRELHCNNKSSYRDYNLKILTINNQTPTKKRFIADVPYMNGNYDFSEIYGRAFYNNRKIEIKFFINTTSYENVNNTYSYASNWLDTINNSEFYLDSNNRIFNGSVVTIGSLDFKNSTSATFNVTFECFPYMKGELFGNDIWDNFNFDFDLVEEKTFEIEGAKKINIVNVGADVEFILNSTNEINFIFNNKDFKCSIGDNIFNTICLKNGNNEFVFNGNSIVEFKFNKQYL